MSWRTVIVCNVKEKGGGRERKRGCIVCKTVTVIVTGDESRHE